MGVSFVDVADPYQSVTRSLKYAAMFIGLVFLSYFLFEVAAGTRVHPAQYILIGVAQSFSICCCCRLRNASGLIGRSWSQPLPRSD